MNNKLRLAALIAAALAGLAVAGSALATYTPRLAVSHSVALPGVHPTTIHASVPQTDDTTAQILIYAPIGYTIPSPPAPGATIGESSGSVYARDTGLTLPLQGTVVAADPAQFTGPPNNLCSPGTHFAVWLLNLSVAGQQIQLPLYVDPTSGPEASIGSFKLRICLGSTETPAGTPGRSPFGSQLLDANFTVGSVFSVPSGAPLVAWRGIFTPYTRGSGVPNAAGTVEARSFVELPGVISLKAGYTRKTNTYRLSGKVAAGSTAIDSAAVQIYRGRTAKVARVSSTKADANGAYATSGRLSPKKTTYFQTRVTVAERDYDGGCSVSLAPLAATPPPCVGATYGGFSAVSKLIRIKL